MLALSNETPLNPTSGQAVGVVGDRCAKTRGFLLTVICGEFPRVIKRLSPPFWFDEEKISGLLRFFSFEKSGWSQIFWQMGKQIVWKHLRRNHYGRAFYSNIPSPSINLQSFIRSLIHRPHISYMLPFSTFIIFLACHSLLYYKECLPFEFGKKEKDLRHSYIFCNSIFTEDFFPFSVKKKKICFLLSLDRKTDTKLESRYHERRNSLSESHCTILQ